MITISRGKHNIFFLTVLRRQTVCGTKAVLRVRFSVIIVIIIISSSSSSIIVIIL